MEVGESFFEFFFSKNRKMSSFHERNGYSLDAIGEGRFLVIIRFVKHYHARVTVKKNILTIRFAKEHIQKILR